ncbi:hypothetical protein BN7_6735 [Wickerhamomyces ciferrii]|uniref:Uncharacterized protein n=1 Tax=Wickerhamomyces ciferrii (strain ATCC 14091 / BCRC 22168 / CBS 111 / JCM 3599 / NBRC 0793 / NRRL Y-1031 F-60-10) TaxID=1206466 RepID=K0L0N2_WICCF|nr:uncharacterized protein BN7_6735 [Wickerhamomyces ciferrii]CCH47124.1 hypothetical protein BN7_6735 [Wickerhamomyces ciferrii]
MYDWLIDHGDQTIDLMIDSDITELKKRCQVLNSPASYITRLITSNVNKFHKAQADRRRRMNPPAYLDSSDEEIEKLVNLESSNNNGGHINDDRNVEGADARDAGVGGVVIDDAGTHDAEEADGEDMDITDEINRHL